MNKAILINAEMIERDLFERHGPMISDEALRVALGYRSSDAFRQALTRKTVPIPIFSVENRRGKYALVKDLAFWLAKQRNESIRQS
ncbi:hypothetical protein [Acinetobacter junii]|uniref:hypothetical protein n=1 Tax=Acinetobacter junii TaxID=40215 RepID=UPI000F67937E|nr:hypothetical protein [Acinetobacter junii]RSE34358.1 hypothetical protein EGT62_06005 [Acinetobacter junii]